MGLLPLAEARRHVLERCPPLAPVSMPVGDALGCVTAAAVVCEEQVPPFDNSAMDGFALRSADVAGAGPASPVVLRVVGTLHAGAPPDLAVGEGEAVRIMTGAPLPAGADAVVMVESTTELDGGAAVEVREAVPAGRNVRPAGDDLRPGEVVIEAGVEITPARVGVLATLGRETVDVHARPRVGVLSTGDELVDGPGALGPGQIRDSNRPMLLALVHASGFVPVDLGRVPDDLGVIRAVLGSASSACDAVITSGGVSMGQADLVKVVLDEAGELCWMQIAIKPAKPFAFGALAPGGSGVRVPVFGLPGNPVSSVVSFELLARPALRRMAGFPADQLDRPRVVAVADAPLPRRRDGKVHFVRVVCRYGEDGAYHVRSAGGQGSHQLGALTGANALAVLPDGDGAGLGDAVEVILLQP
ncbi:molybdopterin molybdotransferase MoeA [Rhabdothermincola sediminis]|uniref:molybdopterin molybdotransferase MoeA n=1 Tax=Rhabdothermincola sediminis TaxID=2751370 RepID=UPI001AA02791|nr:gephyrin-like molybdotransferase Glp [Rhabdothermincola sediminis]